MFRRAINPYTVTDKAVFRNMNETLTLKVRSDAPTLMINLRKAEEIMEKIDRNSSKDDQMDAARFFAWAVFGDECDKLMDFYNDPAAVISAVGLYFKSRLRHLITKAQKK